MIIETKLWNTLYKHQKDTIKWALKNDENKLMFQLDMGLGKTRTSLAYSEQLMLQDKKLDTILIIAQGSKLLDWEEEANELLSGMEVFIINKSKAYYTNSQNRFVKMKESKRKIVIVSYDKIWRWEKDILNVLSHNKTMTKQENGTTNYKVKDSLIVLCDESQKMKASRPYSKVSKFGYKLSEIVEHMILLTGDAISNGYIDLFQQMRIMGAEFTLKYFIENFCKTKRLMGTHIEQIIGYKNINILLNVLKEQAIFYKSEDVLDLPSQNFIDINLEGENDIYNKVKNSSVYEDKTFDSPAVLFGALRQLASGFIREHAGISNHKTKALRDLLESSEDDFVIFYNFNQEKYDILKVLEDMKIKSFEMNGAKKNVLERFKYKGRKVIVSQYMSGSTGQNWQDFNHTLYYSPTTTGSDWKQSMKRTHRIGQSKPVFYYAFKTKGTLESKIYQSLKRGEDYTLKMFEEDISNDNRTI